MEDIRTTGPKGLKGLNYNTEEVETLDFTPAFQIGRLPDTYTIGQDIPVLSSTGDLGRSRFDEDILTMEQVEDVENMRALKQPVIGKWTSGITKGAVLAGTTFLDGTVGLVYGLGSMVANLGNKEESGWETFSRLWDNEFSNGMQEINKISEQLLPNYRTKEERDRAWYQNLGTANFWADTFLKNMGFTVGAYTSGSAFTKLLKGANLIKSGLGAATAGSVYGAVNEARIEANHNSSDFFKFEEAKLQDAYQQALGEIQNSTYDDRTKESLIADLDTQFKGLEDDLRVRKSKMGLTTFIGNAVFLSLNDFYTMGRLYAKGFDSAKNVNKTLKGAKKVTAKSEADKLWAADQGLGKRVKGTKGERSFDEITKLEALGIGGKKSLLEGHEELFQRFTSSTAGEWFSPDSPDSYYKALLDGDAEIETKGFLTAAINGFKDSYGSIDAYEEFAVGFLTGMLGTPTFGRVNNSDASTYLGKGKAIGLSGGVFGELSMANQANKDMKEAIDYINQYEKKLQENQDYFVQSQSFTKAMDGWASQDNKWEYKNAEDNDTFAAISRYAAFGKLDWMREVVNQQFENVSDETLMNMARETSTDVSGWKNVDGSYTPDGEKGAKQMREQLSKKRDTILNDIDRYEDSLRYVNGVANQSLSKDEANELAWYHWKIQKFADRFKDLKDETKSLDAVNTGLTQWEEALLNERFYLTEDKDGEVLKDNSDLLKKVRTLKEFISILKDVESTDILRLSKFLKDNKSILDILNDEGFYQVYADNTTVQFSEYQQTMNNLNDLSKICIAYEEFNKRLKEFTEDPLKLKKNREKINAQQEAKKAVLDKDKKLRELEETSVGDLVKKVKDGDASIEDLRDIAGLDGVDVEAPKDFDMPDELADKVNSAIEILDKYDAAKADLVSRLQSDEIDEQTYNDAISLLENSISLAETPDELLNPELESMLDSEVLNTTGVESAMSEIERQDSKEDRLAKARGVLGDIDSKLANIEKPTNPTQDTTPTAETGRDSTPKVQSEQERKQQEAEITATTEEDKKFLELIKKEVPKEQWGQVYKDFKNVVNNITTLYNSGIPIPEVRNTVSKTREYQNLMAYPKVLDGINEYIIALVNGVSVVEEISSTENSEEQVEVISESNLDDYINDPKKNAYRETPDSGTVNGVKQYWTISTTRYPIHREQGDNRPYYIIAKNLKDSNGKPRYTEAELTRMEAIHTYLENHNTFALRDSGGVKVGDEVRFAIDPKLNESAGGIVILMINKEGNVIGDLQNETSGTAATFVDLPAFIERTTKAYLENKDSLEENDMWVSDEKTKVSQLMVGSVAYSDGRHSLNEIFTDQKGNPLKPTVGVVFADGSISTTLKSTKGNDPVANDAIRPLNLSPGTPVVLIPTSVPRRTHMVVPFTMPQYNAVTSRVGLGKLVEESLNMIPTIKDSKDALKVTKALKEHLGRVWKVVKKTTKENGAIETKEVTIGSFEIKYKSKKEYLGSQAELNAGIVKAQYVPQVRIIYTPNKDLKPILDVTYDLNDPELLNKLKSELFKLEIPFRINRKFLNEKINGVEYNSLLGELANTNIEVGAVHTINNWFTLQPIGKDGKPIKGYKIKTMGTGTSSVASSIVKVKYNNNEYLIDTKEWTVRDASGKKYSGKKTDVLLAETYGIVNKFDSTTPYETPWGRFNPVTKAFEEPSQPTPTQPVETKVPSATEVNEPTLSNKEKLIEEVTSAGMYNDEKRKAIFNSLNEEQLSKFLKYPKPIRSQVLMQLEKNFNSVKQEFTKPLDQLLKPRARKVDSTTYKVFDLNSEIKWLNKVLPQYKDKVTLVEGLIRISEGANPERAWGQFYMGTIRLSDRAASGTVYHEAFHAVANTILTDSEHKALFEEARKLYGVMDDIALEEMLAEDFRRYVQTEELFGGKVVKFFRKIKHFIESFFGKETLLNKLFYDINNGKYADRILQESSKVANRVVEESTTTLNELQQLQKELNSKPLDNTYGNLYEANHQISVDKILKKAQDLKIVTAVWTNNSRGKIVYDRTKLQDMIDEAQGKITKATREKIKRDSERWFKEQSRESKESLNMLYWQDEFRDRDDYDEIEDYHANKLMFGNLNMDDKQFVLYNNFTIEEWNKLHPEHKEAILNCR